MPLLLLAFLLLLATPAPASAGALTDLYHDAEVRSTRDAACRRPVPQVTTPPHEELLAAAGTLRRAATDADRLPGLERFPLAQRVYAGHVRLARTFDGVRFYLIPFKPVVGILPANRACLRRVEHHVARRAPRRLRVRALRYAARRLAAHRRDSSRMPDAVELIVSDSLVVGSAVTAPELRERGDWSAAGDAGQPSRVHLLLPDGVARVRSHHDGHVAEAPVEANLALFHIPAGLESEPELVEWIDASGAVVRQVRMRDEVHPG